MGMINRILGKFPIFAEKANSNQIHNLSGKPYDQSNFTGVADDIVTYELGFKHRVGKPEECFKSQEDVTPEKLNALFNFITTSIAYLYQQGIPEYTMNYSYPKGAVITYKDKVLVSTIDNNDRHPTSTLYWKELGSPADLKQEISKPRDNNPIGTIITVPNNVELDGYIPYVQGTAFNKDMYPELFNALGSFTFGTIGSTIENELPLGTIVHSLNTKPVPEGWVAWEARQGILTPYPELKRVLSDMVQLMPLGENRTIWENALMRDSFPQFTGDFFLRSVGVGIVGDYVVDSVKSKDFNIMPVIVDESTTLNPRGIMRCGDDTRVHSPINGMSPVSVSNTNTNVVITGNYIDKYQDITEARMFNVNTGTTGLETAPKHVKTRLLVKARNSSSTIPSTHKQLIKAFEV